jgi:inner membrane protein
MENQQNASGSRVGNWLRTSLLVKLLAIGFIALLLLIPAALIQSVIGERQNRKAAVVQEISASWGGEQTVSGPILSIPYEETVETEQGEQKSVVHKLYFLPQELHIRGDAQHEVRRRGLFDAILYTSKLTLEGKFEALALEALNVPADKIRWQEARLCIGISSMTGIKNDIELEWNGQEKRMEPGAANPELLASGISVGVPVSEGEAGYTFSIPLELNGADALYFEPVGRVTTATLSASWPSPSFSGNILPTRHRLGADGFEADWRVLDFNRNYPQQWKGMAYNFSNNSYFGVRLIRPVDEYLKSSRASKYAILVIGLTFLIYFFFETLRRFNIHPFQYLLVGLALVVFYLLLLSLSEQIGFNAAYGLASVATIGLISFYSASVLRIRRLVVQLTSLLAIIYGFIFVVLQLEDYALLAGSIGIFIALASVMYYSRKVDWDNLQA